MGVKTVKITTSSLIILTAIFLVCFGNVTFFTNVIEVYSFNVKNIPFISSLIIILVCINIIVFSLICYKYTIKAVLITLLIISSAASYFMDTYNVVIDQEMIDNIFKTDVAETSDLISIKFILYFILLGVLPSVFVYKANIQYKKINKELISKLKLLAVCVVITLSVIMVFGKNYASFFREYKSLRYYTNPSYYLYSLSKYLNEVLRNNSILLIKIGLDAKIPVTDVNRELVIFVVGETARADRFEINGYDKETNPYLKNEDVLSFTNFWACGTSTAVSVPCMFSIYNSSQYDKGKMQSTENVLDVLRHAGVNVLWLDNNSSSKGVASRVPYESYKTSENNPICDIECRDEGMLVNLQTYIDTHPQGDVFVVLHQMGNHGPAYFKRYPATFEKFTPVCKTNQLEECTEEQISNTYDNAILYTDYFLSKTIALLKRNDAQFESVLVYVSDHGESLGEKGLYLHGLPMFMAPKEQLHVPMIMWFSDNFDYLEEIGFNGLREKLGNKYSHDNLFHTILGLMEVRTNVYDKKMDLIDYSDVE